jgi:hypothetical protein
MFGDDVFGRTQTGGRTVKITPWCKPTRFGQEPVSSAARDGEHTDEATMKLVKRRTSLARRSKFGVRIVFEPKQPRSP